MNERRMVFSLPEGGSVTLTLDGSATPQAIDALEEATTLMFRTLRRGAGWPPARDAGAIEYDSWIANLH
ncbi:MAG: hypothetical protein ACK4V1_00545 [Burkholderiaceae bacterium]